MGHDRLAPLRHPAFVGSLALLVINDHLLKGSAVPGLLTGKLSDFAGLVVGPMLVRVALGLGLDRQSRTPATPAGTGTGWHMDAFAMALVTSLFVATESSQALADLVAAVPTALGVPSRLHADLTDLVALSVLPLTWRVMRGARPEVAVRGSWSLASGRALFAVGLFACLATSPRPTVWSTSAYLLNATAAPIDVRVRWADVDLACPEVGERTLSTIVSPEVLTSGSTFRVMPGATIPLDDWAALAARGEVDAGFGAPQPPPRFGEGCVIGLVAVDGLPDTLVLWPTETLLAVPTAQSAGTLPETGRVSIVAASAGLALETSADLRAEAYDARFTPSECALDGEVGTSEPASFEGPAFEVASVSTGLDGCVRLDFAMGTRDVPFFVCAPRELVPFAAGDVVRVDASDDRGVRRIALVSDAATLVLLRARGSDASSGIVEAGITLSIGEEDRCLGARMECGSFVVPRSARISGASAGEDPRGVVRRTSPMGRPMRMQIVRSEWVIAASPSCGEGREVAGSLLDAVVLYE
jgi:hypothetical protein